MTPIFAAALLASTLAAPIEVKSSDALAEALPRLRPGDTLRLGPGTYRASLGRLSGVSVRGAGPEVTQVLAAEGSDGAVIEGAVELSGLALRAGESHCGLKVRMGHARLRDLVLTGGSCGLFVDGGSVEGERVDLRGGLYGLLARQGDASIAGGSAHGGSAGVAMLSGTVTLSRMVLFGPSQEAALSVASGEARLDTVVIVQPGPTGIAVGHAGRLVGRDVTVAGSTEVRGISGDCVQSIGGEVRLGTSELFKCGGAAVEAASAHVTLDGVDLEGGESGCIALVDQARADLQGNRCSGGGPALVLASGSTAQLRMNRWLVDPVLWVECATGARARLLYGEREREPCQESKR